MTGFTPTVSAACRRLSASDRRVLLAVFSGLSQRWHSRGDTALAQVIDAMVLELADARDEHAAMVETFDEIVSPVTLLGEAELLDDDPDEAA